VICITSNSVKLQNDLRKFKLKKEKRENFNLKRVTCNICESEMLFVTFSTMIFFKIFLYYVFLKFFEVHKNSKNQQLLINRIKYSGIMVSDIIVFH
jgi:hypothetical protein